MKKEVVFYFEGNPVFIQLPKVDLNNNYSKGIVETLELLSQNGIMPLYEVYENVKVRYLTLLIDHPIPENIIPLLPSSAEYRPNNNHPYILVDMTIICFDASWFEIINNAWQNDSDIIQ
jgi:hypothetical protein